MVWETPGGREPFTAHARSKLVPRVVTDQLLHVLCRRFDGRSEHDLKTRDRQLVIA